MRDRKAAIGRSEGGFGRPGETESVSKESGREWGNVGDFWWKRTVSAARAADSESGPDDGREGGGREAAAEVARRVRNGGKLASKTMSDGSSGSESSSDSEI
jgi:hypothetical protein